MSVQVKKITEMIEMLPEKEQELVYDLVKMIVLAWDSEFTKMTPAESEEFEEAKSSGHVDENDIDWEHLEKYE